MIEFVNIATLWFVFSLLSMLRKPSQLTIENKRDGLSYIVVNIYWESTFVSRYYGQVWTRNWRPGFTSTSITSLPIISAPALSLTTFIKANIHHVIHKEEAFSLPAMQTNTMYIQSNQRNYNPECWPLCLKSWSGHGYYYFDARFISHNNCKYKSIYSLIPNLKKSCNH